MKRFWIAVFFIFQSVGAQAALVGQTVEYKQGDTVLEGYLAYDDATEAKRPGILVVHEWKGLGDYAKRRADQLAAMGFVAFAADMYGKNVRPQSHEEAAKVSGIYKNDRSLMRSRAMAALEVLKNHPMTDDSKMAAIGYCFGGTTALELARAGVDIKGAVSFHGDLSTPDPSATKSIKAKILVFQGAEDKFTLSGVEPFKKEMKEAGADLRFEMMPGAVHSFTVKEAGNDPSTGMAYNEAADKKSWEEMRAFFHEIFI